MDDRMNDVIDEVQKRLGEEYEVKRVEVMKNNDTKLKGIQVRRKDMNVVNGSSNLVEFCVKMGKMNCNL